MNTLSTSTQLPTQLPTTRPRPVAHWVREQDDRGRSRLVMVWSVADVDAELTALAALDA